MIDTILDTLFTTFKNKEGRPQKYYVQAGREALKAAGIDPNPVGVGNSKTGLPGTYRPVGSSCPSSCALLDSGCYAQKGRVNLAQSRAKVELAKDLAAAALAMVAASLLPEPAPARLHVSGDLLKNGELDQDYISGLKELAQAIPSQSPIKAYLYTHYKGEYLMSLVGELREAGIALRPSTDNEPAPGMAFVAEKNFSNFREIKLANPGVKMVKCREQVDGTPCISCGICWNPTTQNHCVIFAKH